MLALRLTADGGPLDTDRMRHTPLTILLLLGLACTRVDSGSDEALAEASSESTTQVDTSATSSESVGPADTSSSEAGSESAASSESSTASSESSTDATSETSTSETSAETTSETGFGGVTVDLGVLALLDVNPHSATFDQKRHPSDHEGQLSAWYFAHAT